MSREIDTGFSLDEIMELSLSQEDIMLINNWRSVFKGIAEVSKVLGKKSSEITFSDTLDDNLKIYFMKLGIVNQKDGIEPSIVRTDLFLSPKGEKDNGLYIQMNSAETTWQNGNMNGLYVRETYFIPTDKAPLDKYNVALAASKIVKNASAKVLGTTNPFSLNESQYIA